ncbi:MAG TPA: YtxH domain-containing protein [Nitrospirota bacterium]|nr:YtxH domain-containing protein [Nitrospirota bacterium]
MKENLENEKRGGSILVPFLVGAFAGAIAALLLAPKAGKELRKDIKDFAANAKDNLASAIDTGKGYYEGSVSAVKTAIDAGKSAYVEERDKHRHAA